MGVDEQGITRVCLTETCHIAWQRQRPKQANSCHRFAVVNKTNLNFGLVQKEISSSSS